MKIRSIKLSSSLLRTFTHKRLRMQKRKMRKKRKKIDANNV